MERVRLDRERELFAIAMGQVDMTSGEGMSAMLFLQQTSTTGFGTATIFQ